MVHEMSSVLNGLTFELSTGYFPSIFFNIKILVHLLYRKKVNCIIQNLLPILTSSYLQSIYLLLYSFNCFYILN